MHIDLEPESDIELSGIYIACLVYGLQVISSSTRYLHSWLKIRIIIVTVIREISVHEIILTPIAVTQIIASRSSIR